VTFNLGGIQSGDIQESDIQSGDIQSGDIQSGDIQSGDIQLGDIIPLYRMYIRTYLLVGLPDGTHILKLQIWVYFGEPWNGKISVNRPRIYVHKLACRVTRW
jgi:hypothetical protein